jgi:hypothetical protein
MSGQLTQSPTMNRAETATMVDPRSFIDAGQQRAYAHILQPNLLQPNLPDAELILSPDSNHGSHFQFTAPFNRYVTNLVDR